MTDEAVRHYCGLFGVSGDPQAAILTHLGLYAQQHRGQESAGICTSDGRRLHRHAEMGLVNDVFTPRVLDGLVGSVAIGHVRYSTTGSSCSANAQPLLFEFAAGSVCLGHNGTLTNAVALRKEFEARGHIFQTSSDTEVIVHLLAAPEHQAQPNPLASVLERVEGAFSLVILLDNKLIAARDPYGFRPLCLGKLASGAYVVASETCALDIVDAEYVRDVAPGEILTIHDGELHSDHFGEDVTSGRGGACIFEHVYFADPSSNIFGENVHSARKRMGEALAREAPVDADLVIPVPNCARCAAIGYSGASGLPLGRGFTTSHYAGRSFILPDQAARDLAVKLKLNVIKDAVRGKRLVVVEDSVVRGTTTQGKISALRRAGATEIHLRVASPPLRHPCYYGIDFPDPSKLIAKNRSVDEIREYLGVDSLHYLSVEGMLGSVSQGTQSYCTACFTGDYPTRIRQKVDKLALEQR
ncbi:MAG: amidophosphoribosyltransferase [Phycisphaerales bacterium]|nr:amidophosphoribosyltransferase [Phycisphaerales bacterium]